MRKLRVAALTLLLAGTPATTRAQSPPPSAFCGVRTTHPRLYSHVVWIWMENHGFDQIVGSPAAAFINQVIDGCGLATNFHNITHVSLPNYIGATSGLALSQLQPFLLDCNPGGACLAPAGTRSIFSQVPSWKAYEESMTSNCQATGFVGYAVRHNPPAYYPDLPGCPTFDVPYSQLQADLDADTLPAFAFITPNTVDDMHDGADPGAIVAGDTWLRDELPKLVASSAYQRGGMVIFVTFDEGEFGPGFAIGEDCAKNTTDASCHVATIVVSPSTRPGTTSDKLFNHYSLLRTTEQLLGIRKRLGLARRARSMRRPFDL